MRTVSADLARRYEAAGWWTRDTIGDMLARWLAAAPDLEFRVHSEARPWTGTFRDVELVARRLAAGLRQRGVGPGDGVTEVAVVAVPDARLGEHAAAVLRVRPGYQVPDLAQVRGHMEQAGLARQKWPAEIHAVDDFPRTASGKIQKFRLRQNLRQNLRQSLPA
jgi:non-ribosomal peptide synthetase component E (peptide arylation enzyme)